MQYQKFHPKSQEQINTLTSLKSPAHVISVLGFFGTLCNLFLSEFQPSSLSSEMVDSLCVTEGNCSNAVTAQPALVLASCCNSLTKVA